MTLGEIEKAGLVINTHEYVEQYSSDRKDVRNVSGREESEEIARKLGLEKEYEEWRGLTDETVALRDAGKLDEAERYIFAMRLVSLAVLNDLYSVSGETITASLPWVPYDYTVNFGTKEVAEYHVKILKLAAAFVRGEVSREQMESIGVRTV